MKLVAFVVLLIVRQMAAACGPNYCYEPWQDLTRNLNANEFRSFDELMLGQLQTSTLIKTYIPEFTQPDDYGTYYFVPFAERKKALEPHFQKHGITDMVELSSHYRQKDPQLYFKSPDAFIDFIRGMENEKIPEPIIKKLILLRDQIEVALVAKSFGTAPKTSSETEPTIATSSIPGDYSNWINYALIAPSYAYRNSADPTITPESFDTLLNSKSPWIREHALFSKIQLRLSRLLNFAEKGTGESLIQSQDFKAVQAEMSEFRANFIASPLWKAVVENDLLLLSLQGRPDDCLKKLGELTENYFKNRNLLSLRNLNIDASIVVCGSKKIFWQYPLVAAAVPIDSATTKSDLEKQLVELESQEGAYQNVPDIFLYQKARLYLATQNYDLLVGLKLPKAPSRITDAIRVLRYRALMESKRYLQAENEIRELILLRGHNGGAARLLLLKAQLMAEKVYDAVREPIYPDSFVKIVIQEYLKDAQLQSIIENFGKLSKERQLAVAPPLFSRLLSKKDLAAFTKLEKADVKDPTIKEQIKLVAKLNTKPNIESYLAAGDLLRKSLAENPSMTAACLESSLSGIPATTEDALKAKELKPEIVQSFDYYHNAFAMISDQTPNSISTQWEPVVLHRMLSCFRPSNDWYPCWSYDAKVPQETFSRDTRKKWFQRLKKNYPQSAESKALSIYW